MDTPLVTKVRGVDHHIVSILDKQDKLVRAYDITAREYADLALPDAGAPPGVNDGEVWIAYGGVPDYEGSNRLAHGEIAELAREFILGVARRIDGRLLQITIPKDDVTITRSGGLTLSPKTSWPPETEIVKVEGGVLTRLG